MPRVVRRKSPLRAARTSFPLRYELKIALRYLRARRKEAFISVTTFFTGIGVMLGVAALIVMLSVMSGFESDLRQRVLSLSPQVQIQSVEGSISKSAEIEQRANRVPGVAGSDPFIIGQAMLSSAHGISGVIVRGIEPSNPVVIARLSGYIVGGRLKDLESGAAAREGPAAAGQAVGAIAVGVELAEKLKVKVGDQVRAVAPVLAGGATGLATKSADFVVAAVFDSGVRFLDSNVTFMELGRAQDFFGRPGKVDGVEVRLVNLDATESVTASLRGIFPRPYHVSDWREFNEAATAGFAVLKHVYALVLLLLIAVAAFNLIATLIMVVMEKRRDIAVLLAMGASRGEVRLVFVLKGLIVGAVGTAAGLALGALACFVLSRYHFIHIPRKVYGISTLPVDVQPLNFLLVALASLLLCLLATLYPARQASSETPVEVFRS